MDPGNRVHIDMDPDLKRLFKRFYEEVVKLLKNKAVKFALSLNIFLPLAPSLF